MSISYYPEPQREWLVFGELESSPYKGSETVEGGWEEPREEE